MLHYPPITNGEYYYECVFIFNSWGYRLLISQRWSSTIFCLKRKPITPRQLSYVLYAWCIITTLDTLTVSWRSNIIQRTTLFTCCLFISFLIQVMYRLPKRYIFVSCLVVLYLEILPYVIHLMQQHFLSSKNVCGITF